MKKFIISLLLLASFVGVANAGIITRPTKTTGGTSFTDGTIPHASDFNGDADTVYSLVNGSIENANISNTAAIAGSKILAQFATNIQVTTAAAPCFVNIDSSQGADLKQWRICQNGTTLSIATYTDAGAVIITPISIARATGLITYGGGITLSSGGLTISSLTANSFLYSGTAGLLTTTAAPTNGQLLIGSTGAAPVAASISGTANKITVTPGAGTITLTLPVGVILDTATATADPGAALGLATKQYVDAQIAASVAALIPSGTKMVLNQTNCPAGWTKDVATNNAGLRLVSGAAGSGGTVNFTTAFTATSIPSVTGSHVLSVAEMPAHDHTGSYFSNTGGGGSSMFFLNGNGATSTTGTVASQGGGGGHTHTVTGQSLDVKYVDVILCSKN